METFKDTLQTNFSYFNKMTSFTNTVTNIKNHKNHKFTIKWPEHLFLLLLQIKCNENHKLKPTQIPVNSQKYKLSNLTSCLCGALGWTEGTWHMD